MCITCKQYFHGPVRLAIAWGCWRAVAKTSTTNKVAACRELALALRECGQPLEALTLQKTHVAWQRLLVAQGVVEQVDILMAEANMAGTLRELGEHAEVLNIHRRVFVEFKKIHGPEHEKTIQQSAAATWIFRGDGSRRRRGRDVDIPW